MSPAETIARLLREIPDWPRPGVRFLDLTPVFADADALAEVADAVVAPFAGAFDAIAGIESRGFVLGAAAAARSGRGLVVVRKAGKLPREVLAEDYVLEYASATLEVHRDQVPPATRILIVDDVLATGGTAAAAVRLLDAAGWAVAGVSVALEIAALGGREALAGRVESVLRV